ncbi:uncharacterized protein LOC107048678 [Diachasma alloeum]|uniref:uncharacterized protein LOC107048678 n=1 Tax=Diachasma alloeum TaxID=454923 RepID=UPI0007381562|nr:uncharacterized protein LOC107048678 [Diachasma alloeum]XP_015127476.1 uncharacterized protein LOC107048678 [Diachasma alloeum]XP_015127477.1 uncharacterized protein LOC107048678 [Diachasma alloeum]XP_015127478.1 uncharacterized protein LOC107048678 [Diachasma alloeum]
MTLHWWMHWFWVTAQFAVILGVPLPSTTEDPHLERDSSLSWRAITVRMTSEPPIRSSMRIAKAISSYEPSIKVNSVGLAGPVVRRQSFNASKLLKKIQMVPVSPLPISTHFPIPEVQRPSFNLVRNLQQDFGEGSFRGNEEIFQKRKDQSWEILPSPVKDTRLTWLLTTLRPVRRRTEEVDEEEIEEKFSNLSTVEERDLTVLPLRLEETRFKLVVNRSRTINGDTDTVSFSSRTFNGSEDIEIDQELAEPRIASATASPVVHPGLGESTRLSRARSAFTNDFQRDRAQDRSSQDDDDDVMDGNGISAGVTAESATTSLVDIAAITGSCLAMIVLLSTMGSIGFVMYRKKYLNPPQTLNSDKCSNPDSSGYIDDSTIRDNSEEMYSLDNDSFLNSLEAMTIQNYWTDSVKHTKL